MKGKATLPFALPDRYESPSDVLKGGQGEVYICRDRSLDRQVAIKVLRDPRKSGDLAKEIEARAKIKSKHVVEVYESLIGPKAVPLGIVMEFVPGVGLDDESIRQSPLDKRLLLLYQVACGIADIHDAEVIHRDVKPINMKVDSSGVLKIFDLGIANIDASSASTIGGAGTYGFRAPELYLSPPTPPVRVTKAVDVYALGVCAWYLLANRIPAPLLEVPPLKSRRPVPTLSDAIPRYADLAACLDRTLSKDPSNRPSSSEIRRHIAAALNLDRRRGVFSLRDRIYELNKVGKVARLNIRPYGILEVGYAKNGRFLIQEVSGDVYVNNRPAIVGAELPDSCVLTFGPVAAGSAREFVTFDVSQPEIVL